MNINREKLADIETSFAKLKLNTSDVSATKAISDALRSLTNKEISVITISPTSNDQECVVMCVYPEMCIIEQMIWSITTNNDRGEVASTIWEKSSLWFIEIDTRALTDLDLTEKELTALLMHEIGHVIYSGTVPRRISNTIRFKYAQSPMITKAFLRDSLFSKVLTFPVLHSCGTNSHITDKSTIKDEIQADKYSINAGYGKELVSAIDKIIAYAGTSNYKKDMDMLMGFSVDTLISLQKRQNNIVRKNMMHMIASTPSMYAKDFIHRLKNTFTGNPNSKTSVTERVQQDNISDRFDKITKEFYATEGLFNKVHRLDKIDPADIDYIGLEVNNIKCNDDKMMIVSYIYNKIEIIDYYISIIDSKNQKYIVPHTRESLVRMRDMLDKYRIAAINRKIPDVKYGINIQYPTGYEG